MFVYGYGGNRASKFRKRMKERLIDGCDVMVIRTPIPSHHEDYNVVRFVFKYKGSSLIDFPQGGASEDSFYYYGCTTLCALLMVDGYFARKHEVTFGMDASTLFLEVYKEDKMHRNPRYWNRRDEYNHFLKTMADDLMLLLKVCDRRTGKRSLQKLRDASDLKPSIAHIIVDRLKEGVKQEKTDCEADSR